MKSDKHIAGIEAALGEATRLSTTIGRLTCGKRLERRQQAIEALGRAAAHLHALGRAESAKYDAQLDEVGKQLQSMRPLEGCLKPDDSERFGRRAAAPPDPRALVQRAAMELRRRIQLGRRYNPLETVTPGDERGSVTPAMLDAACHDALQHAAFAVAGSRRALCTAERAGRAVNEKMLGIAENLYEQAIGYCAQRDPISTTVDAPESRVRRRGKWETTPRTSKTPDWMFPEERRAPTRFEALTFEEEAKRKGKQKATRSAARAARERARFAVIAPHIPGAQRTLSPTRFETIEIDPQEAPKPGRAQLPPSTRFSKIEGARIRFRRRK